MADVGLGFDAAGVGASEGIGTALMAGDVVPAATTAGALSDLVVGACALDNLFQSVSQINASERNHGVAILVEMRSSLWISSPLLNGLLDLALWPDNDDWDWRSAQAMSANCINVSRALFGRIKWITRTC